MNNNIRQQYLDAIGIQSWQLKSALDNERLDGLDDDLPEIVEDRRTGLLFEPDSSAELAEQVSQLWSDVDLVREYGLAGRDKVGETYNADVYYEKLMAVYERALSNH